MLIQIHFPIYIFDSHYYLFHNNNKALHSFLNYLSDKLESNYLFHHILSNILFPFLLMVECSVSNLSKRIHQILVFHFRHILFLFLLDIHLQNSLQKTRIHHYHTMYTVLKLCHPHILIRPLTHSFCYKSLIFRSFYHF